MESFVYILSSKKNGTLYTGVTKYLWKRIWQHNEWVYEWFTKKYGVKILVYYEKYSLLLNAIAREKQLKKWKRERKIRLIEKDNPEWKNLYHDTKIS
jgi:putative endonuclease